MTTRLRTVVVTPEPLMSIVVAAAMMMGCPNFPTRSYAIWSVL